MINSFKYANIKNDIKRRSLKNKYEDVWFNRVGEFNVNSNCPKQSKKQQFRNFYAKATVQQLFHVPWETTTIYSLLMLKFKSSFPFTVPYEFSEFSIRAFPNKTFYSPTMYLYIENNKSFETAPTISKLIY